MCYGSGSRPKFDMDPDPGKNDTDQDPYLGQCYGSGSRHRRNFIEKPYFLYIYFLILPGTELLVTSLNEPKYSGGTVFSVYIPCSTTLAGRCGVGGASLAASRTSPPVSSTPCSSSTSCSGSRDSRLWR